MVENTPTNTGSRYRDNKEEYDDDNVFDEDEYKDDDKYDDEYDQQQNNNNNNNNNNDQQTEQPRREFKYSTANMNESSNCYKYCMIFLLFLAMMLFMIGLSMILNHFFFSDTSDNGPPEMPERPDNATFPEDKVFVDQACSRGSFDANDGESCNEACAPQYFACCDPFNEFDLYNITSTKKEEEQAKAVDQSKNATNTTDTTNTTNTTSTTNTTKAPPLFQNATEAARFANCTFDQEVRGCMSYAKCQALAKQVEPAPSTLPVLCSLHHLAKDPVSCQELCKPVRCCYSGGTDNCLADNFDICMDYAPCQNLRESFVLETAPVELDQYCLWQQPECNEICEKAKCCGDPQSSCLQANFMACLTYAPCNNVTKTNIKVAPQFSVVPKPPPTLPSACEEKHQMMNGQKVPNVDANPASDVSCAKLCRKASCCVANNAEDNCFFEDPLGCLAWEQQCQVLAG